MNRSRPAVWLADLSRHTAALLAHDRAHAIVPAADRARIGEPVGANRVRERLATHVLLRLALAAHRHPTLTHAALAAPLTFGAAGKPALSGGGPAFSVAHTAGWALVAVGDCASLGVDIETERILRLSERRARAIVAAGTALVENITEADAGCGVLRAWVRLETVAKYRGDGLARLFRDLGLAGAGFDDLTGLESRARDLAGTIAVRDLDFGDRTPAAPKLHAAIAGPSAIPAPALHVLGDDLEPLLG